MSEGRTGRAWMRGPLLKALPNVQRVLALATVVTGAWLLTSRVFPLSEDLLPATRDICTAASALTFVLIAVAASYYPRILHERVFFVASFIAVAGGFAVFLLGLQLRSVPLVLAGASIEQMGTSWIRVTIGISLVGIDREHLGACIIIALLCAYGAEGLLAIMPLSVCLGVFLALPLVGYLLVRRFIQPMFADICASEPPSERSIVRPASFIPIAHKLFICLFIFRFIHGYTLSFGEVDGMPLLTLFAATPVVLIAIWMSVFRRQVSPDAVFTASLLLVICGLLLVPVAASTGIHQAISTILAAGVACFDVMFWYVLTAIAAHNPSGSVLVFSWGTGVTSLGIIGGAFVGRLTNDYAANDPVSAALISSALVFLFIIYMFVVLKRFSFTTTIAGVVPDYGALSAADSTMPSTVPQLLEQRSLVLAERYNLTSRETEVLTLLARGRSGRFIQDELVVSHNTVKAHVKHIYNKMDIHSHQQLIDLIESAD